MASRPLQNRVTPFGEIVATPARGTLMGNRGGCLHDEHQCLGVARWRSRRWIACLLEFKGRKRTVMSPRRYTEIFFLDEATALSAGHRPCAECRRVAFNRFKAAWLEGNADLAVDPRGSVDVIDRHLQRERVGRRREKVTFFEAARSLPDGVFVTRPEAADDAMLVWDGNLYRWSLEGYSGPCMPVADQTVAVLTPRSIVRAIAAGYEPGLHHSLQEQSTAPRC